jgi:hypothetical protein
MNPLGKVDNTWSSNLSYAIGLFTADGCLSSDGRHLEFNSKDEEQVLNFIKCFRLTNKIGRKARGGEVVKKYYRIQFGDVKFYEFLCSIGLKPRKSLMLEKVNIPMKFFPDFLRGLFDGDGSFRIFSHPESKYPQIRVSFASASPVFLKWLQQKINKKLKTKGFIDKGWKAQNLIYAIKDSRILLNYMYYSSDILHLSRKFKKAKPYF